MTDRNDNGRGGRNRSEPARSGPEFIPPEKPGGTERAHRIWISIDEEGGRRRVYVARPGPFTIILALAILGLIGVVMLIVLLSVALIWIPVLIVLIVAFVLSVTLRRYWWRLRNWLAPR